MPKNRKRLNQSGAKSVAIRTKHKIGGRKSNRGANQLSLSQIEDMLKTCRPRDRFKLIRKRDKNIIHVSPD